MNRAFLSLYFFIVISVVLIGWGLDKFWESLAPQNELSTEITDLMTLLDNQLMTLPAEERVLWLEKTNENLQHDLHLIATGDLASSSTSTKILAGEIVPVASGEAQDTWYKRLGTSDQVLVLRAPATDPEYSTVYSGLLVVFYLGIALVIFFWVWPLSRDLAKLERQARHIGKDGVLEPVAIAARSTVYPLANTFNKMARRIRELISSHKEMTYAVSHELRTPLARMKFALAMSEDAAQSNAGNKSLDSIRQDIVEMEGLISSLLLYAGFEQSSGQLQRRDGYMKDMLDEMLARMARDKPSSVTIEVIEHNPAAVFNCEWKLMETVIQNLLQNAKRFAQNRIRIELTTSDQEYQLSVEDDGPGVPESDRARVFDSFVRLYNEDASQAGGFGLGLAIVRRVVQWHGGNVILTESGLGGAKFLVCWPARQPNG
jgi:two-component system OmpR family sensor kinase